ncbi:aminodeoxychorismate lyase [Umezawaea beigongshangensis]|uniref:aminodeoxychorismate lyase n=1 Tax=Umezawaea beigongshangensis TaxID=2780383 RepID=UPI0018F239A0|nr:aminodeoxychorismate lyase [Umezawaea beigongshangensis]
MTGQSRVLALLDGTLADPGAPLVRAGDLGLMRGDGVFETVLVEHAVARELDAHLDRLARSARSLGLPEPDPAAWRRCVAAAVAGWGRADELSLTLVYSRGTAADGSATTGFAFGLPVSPRRRQLRETGVSALSLDRGVPLGPADHAPWLLLGVKSLSYAVNMAAVRHVEELGADDAIFTAPDGTVLEGPTSSLVVAAGGTLRTTSPSLGVLPGTTQRALFEAAEAAGWRVEEGSMALEDLFAADGVFLTSAGHKVTRVHTLDGRPLRDSAPLAASLLRLLDDRYRKRAHQSRNEATT